MAVWFMGDGSFHPKKKKLQSERVTLCTDSFTLEECQIICDWLSDRWNIHARVYCPPSTRKPRVQMVCSYARKFMDIISPYVIHNGKKKWIAKDVEAGKQVPILTPVVKVERTAYKKTVYDIEVADNHNFVVSRGFVVHNSLLQDALPIFKRLKLAQDMLLLARVSKSALHYIYKLKLDKLADSDQALAQQETIESILKRQIAMNLDPSSPNYESRLMDMAVNEDLILTLFGADDVVVEKLGGEPDIRVIADIDLYRRELAMALGIPLPVLGDSSELPSSLGQGSYLRYSMDAAYNAKRLQRSQIIGWTRMAQLDLAAQGIKPDAGQFEIHMAVSSNAEDEEEKDALEKGANAGRAFWDMTESVLGADNIQLEQRVDGYKFICKKFLNIGEADIDKLCSKILSPKLIPHALPPVAGGDVEGEGKPQSLTEPVEAEYTNEPGVSAPIKFGESIDLRAPVPTTKQDLNEWRKSKFGGITLEMVKTAEDKAKKSVNG
jgi:hypothetical protein